MPETATPTADFDMPELMAEMDQEFERTSLESWKPDSEDEARVLRYVRARNKLAGEIEFVKQATKELLGRLENRLKALDFRHESFAAEYARRQLDGKKVRSIKTPFGTIGFRTTPLGIDVQDVAAFLQAMESSPLSAQMLRVKPPEPNKAALLEHFKSSGDLLPGCELREKSEKFYVS